MAIANYGDLKSAVAEWLAKSNLSARASDFIDLASTRIYYGSGGPAKTEPVRTLEMQAFEAPVPVSRVITLPARYLNTIRLSGSTGSAGWTLEPISPAAISEYETYSGLPSYYTFLEGGILLSGQSAATYRHDYYRSFVPFSADDDTNALLTKAPGLWLYGAAIEASLYQKDDASMQRMLSLYNGVASAINRQVSWWAGGGTLSMRAR
jgi:hypothetical protein